MSLALDAAGVIVRGRTRLADVSLRIEPGRLHVLLGPNGAGKSTALALLAGDLRPTSGRATLDGQRLDALPPVALARRRAVMMQRDALAFPFAVDELVSLGRSPWDRSPDSAAERAIVAAALAQAGAAELAGRRYLALSGGERARVQLARALAQIHVDEPDGAARYLLLDEPTASLDFAVQHQVLWMLRRLADRGVGVLAVLQDPNLALRHADDVSLLAGGRLIASGTAPNVLDADRLSALYGLPIRAVRGTDGSLTLQVADRLQAGF